MRNKMNVLNRVEQVENVISKLEFQINRLMSQNELLKTIEVLKEQVGGVKEMISVEPDDFEQQFNR